MLAVRGRLLALLVFVHPSTSRSLARATAGVEIYTTPGCRYCQKAKGFLKARGVPLSEIDISEAPEKLEEMINRSGGYSTLPQIFIGGTWIGGCDMLLEAHRGGTLVERLSACGLSISEPELSATSSDARSTTPTRSPRAPGSVLNPAFSPAGDVEDAIGAAARLQVQMLRLQDEFLSADGSRVDYVTMSASAQFADFCAVAGQLGQLQLDSLLAAPEAEVPAAYYARLRSHAFTHACTHACTRSTALSTAYTLYRTALPPRLPRRHLARTRCLSNCLSSC